MNKYVKIEYHIVGREHHLLSRVLYYSDAEKASAAYHVIDDTLRTMYEHELIVNYYMSMDFTEDIK